MAMRLLPLISLLAASHALSLRLNPPPSLSHPLPSPTRRATPLMAAKKTKPAKKRGGAGGFGAKKAKAVEASAGEMLRRSIALYERMEREGGRSEQAAAQAEYGEEDEVGEEASESLTKYALTIRVEGSKVC